MKIKALLITAAALAAGVITSQAAVYSQNVVGYVNIPEVAGQFSLEAPALDLDGTGTNNTISTVYPNPSIGDQVYLYNPVSGFDIVTYEIQTTRSGSTTNWIDGNTGNPAASAPLNVGQSVYYLPAITKTNTFAGVVLSGSFTNHNIPPANQFNLVGSQIPYGGGLTTVLNYQPNIGDQVYTFNAISGFDVITYEIQTTRSGSSTNWVDGNTGNPGEPQISVGQGFWLVPAAANTWSETYTNQ
jgi:hypothetical protein